MTSIRIRLLWHPQPQFAGYLLAQRFGLGREEGVGIACVPMRFDMGPIQALTSGHAEFAVASPAHMLESPAADEIVFLLTIQQSSALLYPARRSAGITGLSDLAGRRIAVWPGREDLELRWMLRRAGLSEEDVVTVPVADTVQALRHGAVDCAQMTTYHEIHQLEAGAGSLDDFIVFRAVDHGAALLKDGLVARRDWVAAHPAETRAVVSAVLDGWTRAFREPGSTIDLCAEIRPDMSRADHARQFADIRALAMTGATLTHGLGYPDPDHMARARDAMAEVEGRTPELRQDRLVDPGFWQAADPSFRSAAW